MTTTTLKAQTVLRRLNLHLAQMAPQQACREQGQLLIAARDILRDLLPRLPGDVEAPHIADGVETVLLEFKPQLWVSESALTDVDMPAEMRQWRMPLHEFVALLPCRHAWFNEHETRDSLRSLPYAPEWVREWEGPFEVRFAEYQDDTLARIYDVQEKKN